MRRAVDELGQTIVMVTHDPRRRATPTGGALPRRRPDRRPHGRPDAARGPRPPEGVRRLTPDVASHLQVDLGPQAPPDRHLPGGHPRHRLPRRHPGARRHDRARASATCSARSTRTPTPSSAARRRSRRAATPSAPTSRQSLVEQVAASRRRRRRGAEPPRASASSSGKDGDTIGGHGPRRSPATGSRTTTSTRTHSPRAGRPGGATRS